MDADKPLDQRKDPRTLITLPTDFAIAANVHRESPKEKELFLEKNVGEYGTLQFNNGEFAGSSYYAGILSIAYSKHPPVLVYFKKGVKSQVQMAEEIANAIVEISKKIHIIATVIDGLQYQIQAVHLFPSGPTTPQSVTNFQYHLSKANFLCPLPYHLVDLPHIIQLMLTHARDNPSLILNSHIALIDNLVSDLRSRQAVAYIGAKCPAYPATRFFYIVLRMTFMQKKAAEIIDYYNELECIF
jgi:hypothetical protein